MGRPLPRPVVDDGVASDSLVAANVATASRIERLRLGVPLALGERTLEQRARWLLSTLLDFHRREDKPQWWRYFFLRERPMEELVAASDALGGLEYVGVVGEVKQSLVHRYRYDPEQEHPFKAGDPTVDPSDEGNAGTVVDVDRAAGTIDLKRGAHQQAAAPSGVDRAGAHRQRAAARGPRPAWRTASSLLGWTGPGRIVPCGICCWVIRLA